ncbi:hypothetical protein [Jiulongibacter sediminis]|jgi:predicted small secreted protein|uniref:hypothetical protein n=1 Tax=Jiulongibacter sediminis TaxID=1605367 RepID=UPI0026F01FA0|nr:hypothetical protein [Jiulongibacter sediminis]
MMNNLTKLTSIVLIGAAALTSCNSDNGSTDIVNTSSFAATTTPSQPIDLSATTASNSAELAVQPVSTPTQRTSVGTVKHPPTKLGNLMNLGAQRSTFTTASSGLNPAHGMPGHDCSLPVGAPLNSGAAVQTQPVQPVAQQSAALTNIAQPASLPQPNFKANQNVKLNPAHGQPGHDCSVAVGAPLPSSGTTASSVKINPAHGQPGHDCSVAVGAPLPS